MAKGKKDDDLLKNATESDQERRLNVSSSGTREQYKKKPQKTDEHRSPAEQLETLEENDYAGVRSKNGKDVTEKSFDDNRKIDPKSTHYGK